MLGTRYKYSINYGSFNNNIPDVSVNILNEKQKYERSNVFITNLNSCKPKENEKVCIPDNWETLSSQENIKRSMDETSIMDIFIMKLVMKDLNIKLVFLGTDGTVDGKNNQIFRSYPSVWMDKCNKNEISDFCDGNKRIYNPMIREW